MLDAAETLAVTGHPVGGVSPFGLARDLPVVCDPLLLRFATVFPAAGSPDSYVEVEPRRLAELVGATWTRLCRT